MSRYRVTLTPHSSLFIGGYSRSAGTSGGDTATDGRGPLVPASTLKGALREAAVRLTNGAGRGTDLVTEVFGDPEAEGKLRVSPLRLEVGAEGDAAAVDLTLRHHVTLERATRQAAHQRLFQNRVTPALAGVRFLGEIELDDSLGDDALEDEAAGLLLSAAALTDQLGGGRGRGLGLVHLELESAPREEPTAVPDVSAETRSLILELEAVDPLQLGVVKDLTNVITTRATLHGSAVRGAVAAAMAGLEEPILAVVLGGGSPVCFGDGFAGHRSAVPAPLTLREAKAGGDAFTDEALALCAEAVDGISTDQAADTRPAKGTFYRPEGVWKHLDLERRMVTHTARDRASGRGADGQLYSREVLEATQPVKRSREPLRFYVPVCGEPEQLRHVVDAVRSGLRLGASRSRGQGRVRLVGVHTGPQLAPLAERHAAWAARLGALGVDRPEATGAVLTLGPLALQADRLKRALDRLGLELCGGVARSAAHGGWNGEANLPRNLTSSYVAGSTFLVITEDRSPALAALEALEREGLGPGRPDGWGRVACCHPIHLDCSNPRRV